MSSENYFPTVPHVCFKAWHGHKHFSLKSYLLVETVHTTVVFNLYTVLNNFSRSRRSWILTGDTVFWGFLQNEVHIE